MKGLALGVVAVLAVISGMHGAQGFECTYISYGVDWYVMPQTQSKAHACLFFLSLTNQHIAPLTLGK